jgi:hypothetical protein
MRNRCAIATQSLHNQFTIAAELLCNCCAINSQLLRNHITYLTDRISHITPYRIILFRCSPIHFLPLFSFTPSPLHFLTLSLIRSPFTPSHLHPFTPFSLFPSPPPAPRSRAQDQGLPGGAQEPQVCLTNQELPQNNSSKLWFKTY